MLCPRIRGIVPDRLFVLLLLRQHVGRALLDARPELPGQLDRDERESARALGRGVRGADLEELRGLDLRARDDAVPVGADLADHVEASPETRDDAVQVLAAELRERRRTRRRVRPELLLDLVLRD